MSSHMSNQTIYYIDHHHHRHHSYFYINFFTIITLPLHLIGLHCIVHCIALQLISQILQDRRQQVWFWWPPRFIAPLPLDFQTDYFSKEENSRKSKAKDIIIKKKDCSYFFVFHIYAPSKTISLRLKMQRAIMSTPNAMSQIKNVKWSSRQHQHRLIKALRPSQWKHFKRTQDYRTRRKSNTSSSGGVPRQNSSYQTDDDHDDIMMTHYKLHCIKNPIIFPLPYYQIWTSKMKR